MRDCFKSLVIVKCLHKKLLKFRSERICLNRSHINRTSLFTSKIYLSGHISSRINTGYKLMFNELNTSCRSLCWIYIIAIPKTAEQFKKKQYSNVKHRAKERVDSMNKTGGGTIEEASPSQSLLLQRTGDRPGISGITEPVDTEAEICIIEPVAGSSRENLEIPSSQNTEDDNLIGKKIGKGNALKKNKRTLQDLKRKQSRTKIENTTRKSK